MTQPAAAIQLKSGPQLFVDDFFIQDQSNLKRTLHRPNKENGGNKPVLAIENEYGAYTGTLYANGTILYDPATKRFDPVPKPLEGVSDGVTWNGRQATKSVARCAAGISRHDTHLLARTDFLHDGVLREKIELHYAR